MPLLLRLFTLFIYLTFLYELIGIPVPSIASTYQLIFSPNDEPTGSNLLTKVRRWALPLKLLLLLLPTALVVAIYLLPLLQAVWPAASRFLHLVLPLGQFWLLGCSLALLGRIIGLSAAWMMHHQKEATFDLQTRGLFSFTRNPILLGMYVTFIGLWLLYPSWEMGIGFLLLVGNMHFRILLEEAFLQQAFGAAYLEFMTKTRRYF